MCSFSPDGVVGHHVNDTEAAERGEPHASHGVADEVEEGGAERPESPVGEEAVADGRHAVLSHAEAHVAAGWGALLEVARALHNGSH
jgi:hypothetical protein